MIATRPNEAPSDPRRFRDLTTPEGVVVRVPLASLSERFTAFLVDLALVLGAITVLGLLLALSMLGPGQSELAIAATLLCSFLIRAFYFAYFESAWRGATPGKRVVRLRVVSRSGGPLRPDAILARNLVREVEIFLPLTLVLVIPSEDQGGLIALAALVWVGVLVLLPIFNRDRLRLGDIIAGTCVITLPKPVLLEDVARATPDATAAAPDGIHFTDRQLAIYGTYELQVLEELLRDRRPSADGARRAVAERIQRKIGYATPDGTIPDPQAFLDAFYRAQRTRLETGLAFGKRKSDKHDRAE